ncbi:MAG: hypothetical protein ACK4ZJ_13155, partial [Allorhizobium sp.]
PTFSAAPRHWALNWLPFLHPRLFLRKEVAKLKAERDILKNRRGLLPACARYKQAVLSSVA